MRKRERVEHKSDNGKNRDEGVKMERMEKRRIEEMEKGNGGGGRNEWEKYEEGRR